MCGSLEKRGEGNRETDRQTDRHSPTWIQGSLWTPSEPSLDQKNLALTVNVLQQHVLIILTYLYKISNVYKLESFTTYNA